MDLRWLKRGWFRPGLLSRDGSRRPRGVHQRETRNAHVQPARIREPVRHAPTDTHGFRVSCKYVGDARATAPSVLELSLHGRFIHETYRCDIPQRSTVSSHSDSARRNDFEHVREFRRSRVRNVGFLIVCRGI